MAIKEFLESYAHNVNSITIYMIVAFVSIVLLVNRSFKKGRLPPGPFGLPIIGYLPFMGNNPLETLEKLSKKYGNVFRLYLGKVFAVVLNDFASTKEALEKEAVLGRPETSAVHEFVPLPSIATVNGEVWRQQKRFALHQLRDLGFGKSVLEEHMQEELLNFIKEINRQNGKPQDLDLLLSMSTTNNIWLLLFGHRWEYSDPKALQVAVCLKGLNASSATAAFKILLPSWVVKIISLVPKMNRDIKEMRQTVKGIQEIVREEIREHLKSFNKDNIRDYVDGFILEMQKREEVDNQTSFNESFLEGNALAFFEGGSDTTRGTVSWLLLCMAAYQDAQEKAYKEIVDVVGKQRPPCWSDRHLMPYCCAIIAETQRLKSVAPLSLDRVATEDITVQGHFIPKGTTIIANLWAIHHDPSYWNNPEEFEPKRFLSQDGSKFIKNERLIPFSIGKRSCPGETMANVETFLYFATLIQRFKILPRETGKKINLDGVFTVGYDPVESMDSLYFHQRT